MRRQDGRSIKFRPICFEMLSSCRPSVRSSPRKSSLASSAKRASPADVLRENSPADFETTPNAALDCIGSTHYIVEEECWRAGYDSLESFYAAHEARHPDIRVYASVYEDDDPEILAVDHSDLGRFIAERIAERQP